MNFINMSHKTELYPCRWTSMVKTDDYIRKRKDLRQAHGQNNASGGERKKKKKRKKKDITAKSMQSRR